MNDDICLRIVTIKTPAGDVRSVCCLRAKGHEGAHIGSTPYVLHFLRPNLTLQSIARASEKYHGALTRLANR